MVSKHVKSRERVRNHGEVFTQEREVKRVFTEFLKQKFLRGEEDVEQ